MKRLCTSAVSDVTGHTQWCLCVGTAVQYDPWPGCTSQSCQTACLMPFLDVARYGRLRTGSLYLKPEYASCSRCTLDSNLTKMGAEYETDARKSHSWKAQRLWRIPLRVRSPTHCAASAGLSNCAICVLRFRTLRPSTELYVITCKF